MSVKEFMQIKKFVQDTSGAGKKNQILGSVQSQRWLYANDVCATETVVRYCISARSIPPSDVWPEYIARLKAIRRRRVACRDAYFKQSSQRPARPRLWLRKERNSLGTEGSWNRALMRPLGCAWRKNFPRFYIRESWLHPHPCTLTAFVWCGVCVYVYVCV